MIRTLSTVGLFCFTLVVGGCTAPATDHTRAASQTAATGESVASDSAVEETASDSDPLICKYIAPTGSRIARKTCMRQSAWNQIARDAKDATGQVQRNGNLSVNQGG